jgi:hypothetical protein
MYKIILLKITSYLVFKFNNLSAKINQSKFLLFADMIIYRDIKSVEDCEALQTDIDSVHQWYVENCMQLITQETNMISFTRKVNSIQYNYYVKDVLILHFDCIKYLDVMLDSKLYFHCHAESIYSQALRASRLIRFITYNFYSLDSPLVLYIALIRSKLEYASVV